MAERPAAVGHKEGHEQYEHQIAHSDISCEGAHICMHSCLRCQVWQNVLQLWEYKEEHVRDTITGGAHHSRVLHPQRRFLLDRNAGAQPAGWASQLAGATVVLRGC